MSRVAAAGLIAAILAVASIARAAPPGEAAEADARAHFGKGVDLVEQKAWAEALAEFQASRKLHPTWKATKNAAACATELGRYDEALDLLEAVLREFPELPEQARDDVTLSAARLRERVGVVSVEGAEAGAAVIIDDRLRGEVPIASSLRVPVGPHVVRILRDGFEPFEARVVVAAGQRARVDGRLRALVDAGRLLVAEEQGRAATVFVDGRAVGVAPWEGTLTAGDHLVWLRDAGDLGTQPIVVRVAPHEKARSLLAVEPLGAQARIAATPANATITIDGVPVGKGAWEGRLRASAHRIEASAEGYAPARRDVRFAYAEAATVTIPLDRDDLSAVWRRSPRVTMELSAAAFLAPSLGGDVSRGCSGSCVTALALGGRALVGVGLEYRSGFSFGFAAGAIAANQTTTGRSTTITPVGLAPTPGAIDDTRKLRAFQGGAWGAFTIGERRVLRFRLGTGALLGSIGDSRTGRFQPPGMPSYTIGPVGDAPRVAFVYLEPEVRGGLRVTRGLEITAGLGALVLFDVARPAWDPKHAVHAGSDGLAFFRAESLVGSIVLGFTPSVGLRYEL